jgi:crotonobetainyl-CoA:carnitine CoA-transferase CaiB-like acyl-CoA transferase
VEPPGGDPWRAWSAGGAKVDPEDGGALFQFLHHGMRSVVGRPGDREVEDLVAGADVVIESFPPSEFDPQAWRDAHPGLIVCSITPYGRTGPYAERPTTEFIVQAESGGLVGRGSVRADPFQAGGRTSEWLAGTFSAMAVAAAARRSWVRRAPSRRRRSNRRATGTSASAPTAASSSTASCCSSGAPT